MTTSDDLETLKPGPSKAGPKHSFKKQLLVIALVLAASAFVAIAVSTATKATNKKIGAILLPSPSDLQIHKLAPISLPIPNFDSKKPLVLVQLAHGRPMVVNFFASWCSACTAELGAFASVWRSEHEHVLFVEVDTNDPNRQAAQADLVQSGIHYGVGLDDANSSITQSWGLINGLPATFYLDRTGHIEMEILGQQSKSVIARRVSALAAGKPLK